MVISWRFYDVTALWCHCVVKRTSWCGDVMTVKWYFDVIMLWCHNYVDVINNVMTSSKTWWRRQCRRYNKHGIGAVKLLSLVSVQSNTSIWSTHWACAMNNFRCELITSAGISISRWRLISSSDSSWWRQTLYFLSRPEIRQYACVM